MTHASSRVSALRSVALNVPDLVLAEQFYTSVWHLDVAARTPTALYLRGTGADHHLLALHQADGPAQIRHVTLRARDRAALDTVQQAVVLAGGRVLHSAAPVTEPGGGEAKGNRDASEQEKEQPREHQRDKVGGNKGGHVSSSGRVQQTRGLPPRAPVLQAAVLPLSCRARQ